MDYTFLRPKINQIQYLLPLVIGENNRVLTDLVGIDCNLIEIEKTGLSLYGRTRHKFLAICPSSA